MDEKHIEAELKPCPFCGGEGHPHREYDHDWPDKCFMSIRCRACHGQAGEVFGTRDPSEWAEARAAWNRRATQGSAPADASNQSAGIDASPGRVEAVNVSAPADAVNALCFKIAAIAEECEDPTTKASLFHVLCDPVPTTDDTWPIAKLTVAGDTVTATLYAPGLPDGDHDVWPCPVSAPAAQPTVEPNSQEWAGMDGATAYLLIQRHADTWSDIRLMMEEWLAANRPAAPAAQQAPRPECFEFAMEFLGEPESSALRAYVERLEAAQQAPAGWVMVPVEPTPSMYKAGAAAIDARKRERAQDCWRAMLAAAPQQQGGGNA